ncbi:MAG: hypothetical protein IPL49_10285 [Saprospirales bacterium]|nr:hypothetical protein [Saprospirales bacterium]MBK8491253.1 hypothetical protein [Saprospirales bacterium]
MKNMIFLFFSGMLLFGCGVSKTVYQQEPASVIKLSRGVCFGTCPNYDLTIDGNGHATYLGKRFVDKIGTYSKTFTPEETNRLFRKFQKADFWAYQDEYYADISDLPMNFITFESEGRSKKIKAYYGVPESLQELMAEVDAYANTEGWESME